VLSRTAVEPDTFGVATGPVGALFALLKASVDAAELARFEALGESWWDADGPMKALHEINPQRITYLLRVAKDRFGSGGNLPLRGLRVLDIGCGAGLLCEPLARLGAIVTGIDPGEANIAVARRHAEAAGLEIDYRCGTAESLSAKGEAFDLVLAMEVVEHVADVAAFLGAAAWLVRPGGVLVASTINRTLKSFGLAIVAAEYVLRWVAKGTHQWEKFITPPELRDALAGVGLDSIDETGLLYSPLRDAWSLGEDTGVNYFMTAVRPS